MTFACVHCGARAQPAGESCSMCGSRGTLLEDVGGVAAATQTAQAMALRADEVRDTKYRPRSTGFAAWDEALGGGLVLPSSVLLYGPPGSMKTTYAAAIAENLAHAFHGEGLYLCGEMPTDQVKAAAKRLAPNCSALLFAGSDRGATEWQKCEDEVARIRPRVVVYDSIQAIEARGESAGSMRAVRAVVRGLLGLCARQRHIAIAISQVNAEGQPAGPRRTKHDCDVVAWLQKELLTIEKNRFHPAPLAVPLIA